MKYTKKTFFVLVLLLIILATGCSSTDYRTDIENTGKLHSINSQLEREDDIKITLVSTAGDRWIKELSVTPGEKYGELPVPERDGYIFLGWFDREYGGNRLLKHQVVDLKKDTTFYGQWVKQSEEMNQSMGEIPILMYHWFYDGEPTYEESHNGNWMPINEFEEQMKYLHEEEYYFPSWDEVELFLDGKLSLPKKSIVITDDDGKKVFFELAIPVIKKYDIEVTSFLITSKTKSKTIKKFSDENVRFRSHSHNLHIRGSSARGIATAMSVEQIREDLSTSSEKLGESQVFAYPFGHYNETLKEALLQENFTLAVTTQDGFIKPGMDKLELPRVRISSGKDLETYKRMISDNNRL